MLWWTLIQPAESIFIEQALSRSDEGHEASICSRVRGAYAAVVDVVKVAGSDSHLLNVFTVDRLPPFLKHEGFDAGDVPVSHRISSAPAR